MTATTIKRRLRMRAVVLGILGLGVIIAGALAFMRASDSFFMGLKGEHLRYLATSLADQIDADSHATIEGPEDMGSEAYLGITGALERMQRVSGTVISAYTLRLVGGRVFFIVSPPADYDRDGKISGELEVRDPVGLPYEEPPDEAMEEAAVRGMASYTPSFTEDRWGTFLTGCAPLKKSDGVIEGAVCVDEDAGSVRADMRTVNWMTVLFAAASAMLMIAALAGYVRARVALADRVEAERHREKALMRFEAAVENTPMVAVQAINCSGTIHVWNRASQITYGYSRDEALGKNIGELLMDEKEAARFSQALKKVCDTKRPAPQTEWVARDRKGDLHVVQASIFPVMDGPEIAEIFCMDVDVTERNKGREELQKNLDHMKSFYDMMVGRESRMLELKREINDLCDKLGTEKRYTI